MRLYDNAPDNYHDELASMFPAWYRDVLEMDALWNTWGVLLDRLREDIKTVLNNYFLPSCDEQTVEFWESFIGASYSTQHSLEYRRRYIMTHFSGFGKCSATRIRSVIKQYTGSDAIVRFQDCDVHHNQELYIQVVNGTIDEQVLLDMQSILNKIIPAHIPVNIQINLESGTATAYPMTKVVSLHGRMTVVATR